jgi:RNA-splicing ligase RtcB
MNEVTPTKEDIYKEVVRVTDELGISKKVARLKPIIVIIG